MFSSRHELSWNPNRSANQFVAILTTPNTCVRLYRSLYGQVTPARTALADAPVSGTLRTAVASISAREESRAGSTIVVAGHLAQHLRSDLRPAKYQGGLFISFG